jgi:hypothetical protein
LLGERLRAREQLRVELRALRAERVLVIECARCERVRPRAFERAELERRKPRIERGQRAELGFDGGIGLELGEHTLGLGVARELEQARTAIEA